MGHLVVEKRVNPWRKSTGEFQMRRFIGGFTTFATLRANEYAQANYELEYCCSLVGDFKLICDWRWRKITLRGRRHQNFGAMEINRFFQWVLPFSHPLQNDELFHHNNYVVERIYSRQVVPHERAFYPFISHERNVIKLAEPRLGNELPIVEKIGELPLYAAVDHGNLLALARRHNDQIECRVVRGDYPAADELKICSFNNQIYVLRYEKLARIIHFPDVTLPLLLAYGVGFPVDVDRNEFRRIMYEDAIERKRPVKSYDPVLFFPTLMAIRDARRSYHNGVIDIRVRQFANLPQPCGE